MSTATLTATRYLTTTEAAAVVGYRPQTLINWRSTGLDGPPFVRLGPRRVRYEREAVEQWLAARTVRVGGDDEETD